MPRSPKWILACVAALAALGGTGCDEVRARRDIQEGNKKYQESKYEEAVVLYEGALKSRPELAIGWFNLGTAHFALYNPGTKEPAVQAHATKAAEAFLRYVQMVPTDQDGRTMLLKVYKDSGNYDGAIKYYDEVLAKDPNNLVTLGEVAQTYVDAGKFDDAIKWYKRLIEVDTSKDNKADTYARIGILQWRRLNNHAEVFGLARLKIADEGIDALQQANELRQNHPNTLTYWNLLYRERSTASEASYARALDTASALGYQKQAMEAMKAAQAASNSPPGAPAPKDPKAPAPQK
jgi:tetratricopeptide (TPR) repeat protein